MDLNVGYHAMQIGERLYAITATILLPPTLD